MFWSWFPLIAALVVAAGCSFFFALAESALFALGKWRAQQLAEDNPASGKWLRQLFSEPQDLLGTLVLGNTLANGLVIGLTAWVLAHTYLSETLIVLAVFILVLAACEVVPKALAVRAPEFWSLRLARPVLASTRMTRPLRKVAQSINEGILRLITPRVKPQPPISDEEYGELLTIAQKQGALGKAEREIILQILTLDQRTASDVMRPRSQISVIPDDLTREEMIEQCRKLKHTRIPMYDESPDTIVGVLNAREFLMNPEADLEEVIEFPSFVPASMNLLQLLRSLQRQRRGIAIVVDEFGGTAGLVTLEDIIEETLGSFRPREARSFAYERLGQGQWRVNGACLVEEFRREFPALKESEEVDTMAGLMVRHLEYVPAAGESVQIEGLIFKAEKVEDRRVRQLLVEVKRK